MFNTYHAGNHTNNIKINAVAGAILKNHPKSWFERFHLKSQLAKELLKEGGFTYPQYHDKEDKVGITVLQMVICGDMEVMAELVYTKDYEQSFADTSGGETQE